MPTIVIQLCEAKLICANTAAVYIRIRSGSRVSRPIPCCASCRPEVEAKIAEEACTFTAETIGD